MTTIFTVSDMTCGHCEKTVRAAITEVLPNAAVTIDLPTHKVTVESATEGAAAKAEEAIREAGYTPEAA